MQLLTAISQLSVLTGEKMQLIGGHTGNEIRNATLVETKTAKGSNSSESVIP